MLCADIDDSLHFIEMGFEQILQSQKLRLGMQKGQILVREAPNPLRAFRYGQSKLFFKASAEPANRCGVGLLLAYPGPAHVFVIRGIPLQRPCTRQGFAKECDPLGFNPGAVVLHQALQRRTAGLRCFYVKPSSFFHEVYLM